MKLAFIQKEAYEKLSVHQLSAVLKKDGHECDIFIFDLEKDFYKTVEDFSPDIILYSLYISEETFMKEAFGELKKRMPGVTTIVGGPFCLIFPEIAGETAVDIVLRGDGEQTLPQCIKRLKDNESLKTIPGICFTDDKGGLYKNPSPLPICKDLNLLPDPDRDLYYKYDALKHASTKYFIVARGCPFSCTFCYNAELKKFFLTPYWRVKEPIRVINEIKYVKKKYGLKWVQFQDGTFTANKRWMKAFLTEYQKHDLPPFLCNGRQENFDEQTAKLLKASGCDRITFGVQTGNEDFRRVITGRKTTTTQILKACEFCKKYDIRVSMDVIFGWPGETLKEAMDTIRLCRKADIETYSSNVLVFYPGVWITNYAFRNGFIDAVPRYDQVRDTNPNISLLTDKNKTLLVNIDKFFYYLIRFPKLEKLILMLIKLPPNRIFIVLKNLHILMRTLKYTEAQSKMRIVMDYVINSWKSGKN